MAVKGVGMIAAGGKGGPTSFPTFIGGRSPQSCTVTDFEMETSNSVLGRYPENQNGNLRWHLP